MLHQPNKDRTTTPPQGDDVSHDVRKSLTPHVCPVCCGNGIVPNGFYNQTSGTWLSSDATPDTCRSCGGTGVLWG